MRQSAALPDNLLSEKKQDSATQRQAVNDERKHADSLDKFEKEVDAYVSAYCSCDDPSAKAEPICGSTRLNGFQTLQ